jgi:hypothetical protein
MKRKEKDEFPKGWDENRVQKVLAHYENQTEEGATSEDEAAWKDRRTTFIEVPTRLLPRIRELLARTAL